MHSLLEQHEQCDGSFEQGNARAQEQEPTRWNECGQDSDSAPWDTISRKEREVSPTTSSKGKIKTKSKTREVSLTTNSKDKIKTKSKTKINIKIKTTVLITQGTVPCSCSSLPASFLCASISSHKSKIVTTTRAPPEEQIYSSLISNY